jgi:hypothetical protein
MSSDQPEQLGGFVDRTGGSLYGGDNLMSVFDYAVSLIAQPAL